MPDPSTSIRAELPSDVAAIEGVIERAFSTHPFSDQTEHLIVRALRDAGALAISLVALGDGEVVGHVAFSRIAVADGTPDWYGLGPMSVDPDCQSRGIGSRLVLAGLEQLRAIGAAGCVVLGEPGYYARFGFRVVRGLVYPGPPPEHFLAMSFGDEFPRGEVEYHAAFGIED